MRGSRALFKLTEIKHSVSYTFSNSLVYKQTKREPNEFTPDTLYIICTSSKPLLAD